MVSKVRFSYLPQQFADPDEILREIKQQLLVDCDFTLGPAVTRFEEGFARAIGSRFGVGVGSGTDAIFLSLKALDLEPGEVITAANTFIATVGAIHAAGHRPVLVDATDYFTLDPAKLEAAITPRTRAIVPVHFAGEAADMKEILAIAKRHQLPVIEDSCQAIDARLDGKGCGTMGIAGAFSVHPLKNINVWGDGGIILTDDSEVDRKLRLLRNHGLKNRDEVAVMGYNSRLDTLQAIVGNWLLPRLEEITSRRIENGARYDRGLTGIPGLRLPHRRPEVRRVFHLYMLYSDRRDALLAHLISRGIEAKVHYPIPLHLQEGLRQFGYKRGDFPVSEEQSRTLLTLPADQHLSDAEIDYVIETIRSFHGA